MNKKTSLWITGIALLTIVLFCIYKLNKNSEVVEQTGTPLNTVSYSCDNAKKITAAFFAGKETAQTQSPDQPPTPTGSVKLTFGDGSTMTLNQTISADGGRYANKDESFVFWDKGNGAMVLQNGSEKDYTNCMIVMQNPPGENLPQTFISTKNGFSIRLPEGYTIDESYSYQMTPTKIFSGVKFTIPESTATGTNLGSDTYISIEKNPQASSCTANLFLDDPHVKATNITDNNTDYSVASSTGAGAGNRYEETVYAMPGTNPCTAIRYFVHYGVFENYPAGSVKKFDEQSLLSEFDAIRHTLTIK